MLLATMQRPQARVPWRLSTSQGAMLRGGWQSARHAQYSSGGTSLRAG